MSTIRSGWMRFLDRLNPLAARQTGSAQVNIAPAPAVTYAHPPAGRKKEEFVVIGLGRFGTAVTRTLVTYGHNVLAIDNDIQRVQDLSTSLPHVLQLDATNVDALRQAGVEAFDTGLVCIGPILKATCWRPCCCAVWASSVWSPRRARVRSAKSCCGSGPTR